MENYTDWLLRHRKQIIETTTPSKAVNELSQLMDQIIDYQLRVRGIPSQATALVESSQFNSQTIPKSFDIAAEIDHRLRLLASYQLKNANRVIQLLLAGLAITQSPTPTQQQTRFFSKLHEDPLIGNMKLANSMGISPRTVKTEKNVIFSEFGSRIASWLDPHRFGLIHLGIHIRTKSLQASQDVEKRFRREAISKGALPFLHGFSFDVNRQDAFISLFVPDQIQARTKVNQIIHELSELYFEEYEIHQILGFYEKLNLTSYDHVSQEWQILSDLRTEGSRRFIEEYGPQFQPPRGFSYTRARIEFNQSDWILVLSLCEGLLERKERRELLTTYGFQMADKTVWAHENQLHKTGVYFPYLTFSRLYFDEIICLMLICDSSTFDFLKQFITQFTSSQLLPTEKGAIIKIGTFSWAPSLTNQLIHTLLELPDIDKVSVMRLKREVPQVPAINTFNLWNAKTKRWDVPPV